MNWPLKHTLTPHDNGYSVRWRLAIYVCSSGAGVFCSADSRGFVQGRGGTGHGIALPYKFETLIIIQEAADNVTL